MSLIFFCESARIVSVVSGFRSSGGMEQLCCAGSQEQMVKASASGRNQKTRAALGRARPKNTFDSVDMLQAAILLEAYLL